MRGSLAVLLAVMILPLATAAGITIQNRDMNIINGNIILSGGGILGSSGILDILSDVIVNGTLDALGITANSISVGDATVTNSLVVSGTSSLHNVLPGTGDWNVGSITQPWAWIFGKSIYAQNLLCLAGTCISSWDEVNQDGGTIGTGAPDYLAKWDNTGTGLTTSIIYDNGTNVGIDTNTPSYKLEVSGDFGATRAVVSQGGHTPRTSGGHIVLPGPTSDYIITVQDGTGRIQHYWNASPGTSPTYLVSNEAAGKMLFSPSATEFFVLYWAPSGTQGATISWQKKFSVDTSGQVLASRYVDMDNTSYYVDAANTGTSAVLAGSVGIGKTPTYMLDVAGQANAQGYCINGDCITSWNDVRTGTPQDLTASRDLCTLYTNNTGKPILVNVTYTATDSSDALDYEVSLTISPDGTTVYTVSESGMQITASGSVKGNVVGVVPAGYQYQVCYQTTSTTATISLLHWQETELG